MKITTFGQISPKEREKYIQQEIEKYPNQHIASIEISLSEDEKTVCITTILGETHISNSNRIIDYMT